MELKIGSSDANTGGEVTPFQQWFKRYAASYAPPVDGYIGHNDEAAINVLQYRLQMAGKRVTVTGRFDQQTADAVGYRWKGVPTPPPVAHRPIWAYSAPGSGVPSNVGPPFDLGEWVHKTFNINHQTLNYPIGGYLGIMGGDPAFSYNDIIGFEDAELEKQLLACPDLKDPNLELWFFCYSQSADGMKRAVARLFGDGGRFAHLRSRINGIIAFGDPTRAEGPTKSGNNPKGYGIARRVFPAWLNDLTWSITNNGDMYACAQSSTLLPLFYEWFIKAETELPFVIYTAGIIIPAIASYVGIAAPLLSGILGTAGAAIISGITGVALPFLTQMITGYGGGDSPNPELVKALSAQGLLTPQGIIKVVSTLAALPGIQTHGEYYVIKPEFRRADGLERSGFMAACDVVAQFRR